MLKLIFRRSDVELREHQLRVLEAIATGGQVVYVAGVGGGKTLAFTLPTFTQQDGVTVVIQPLKALLHDTKKRLEDWGIRAMIWEGDEPEGSFSVLLVSPEAIESNRWDFFVNRYRDKWLIDRVVLDEAYAPSPCWSGTLTTYIGRKV